MIVYIFSNNNNKSKYIYVNQGILNNPNQTKQKKAHI